MPMMHGIMRFGITIKTLSDHQFPTMTSTKIVFFFLISLHLLPMADIIIVFLPADIQE